MHEHVSKLGRPRWRRIAAVLSAAAFAIAVLAVYTAPSVHAAPPPGDCWGGALSDDPLHFYVLEEAQRAGVIEVTAIYEGGAALYVYLAQSGPAGPLHNYFCFCRVMEVRGNDGRVMQGSQNAGCRWDGSRRL